MIIDKKGKIFGKVNILDVIIVLIIVCFLALGAVKLFSGVLGGFGAGTVLEAEVLYTVEVTKQSEDYFEKINVGDRVYQVDSDEPIGEVIECSTLPSRYLTENKQSLSYELTEVEGKYDGHIKIKSNLKFENPDFLLDKKSIKIGSDVELVTRGATLKGYVIDIEYDEELVEGK